jgi:hypothetical protein
MPSDAKPSRRPRAYAFKIDTTMRELFRRLSADDPWQWVEGDSPPRLRSHSRVGVKNVFI